MLETSRLPKGEKGKERRGISVLKQTRRSPDPCWEKGRARPWRGWFQGGLAEEPSPGRVGGMERDGGSISRAGFVPAPPCAGRPAVFPSREAGICCPSRDALGNTPKKLLPGGETGGQELWGHSVSLHHHHLNQPECWHHGLALGWSPPSSGVPHSQVCWITRGANKARAAVPSLRCPAASPLLGESSARRRCTPRDLCSARIRASSEKIPWDGSRETEGGPCLIFIVPPQLPSHLLIFNSPGS